MDGGPEPASITQRRPFGADEPPGDSVEQGAKASLEISPGDMVGS
jgi:hypothetical protein